MKKTLLALSLLGLTAHTFAADLLETVQQRGTLKIALEGTYPPFNFKDKSQKLTGFEVELGEALAKKLKLKPEFITGEWSGLLAGLQGGKFDVVLNQVSITDKRKEVFDFSVPYTISSAQLIVRKDEKRSFKSLADLAGKKMGVTQGSNYAEMVKAQGGIESKFYPSAPEILQDLSLGRIDAAINDSLLIPFALKEAKLPLKAGAPVGGTTAMGIPFAKGNPKFKTAIDGALNALYKDGSFKKISVKWFGIDVSKAPSAR